MEKQPILQLRGINKSFNKKQVLNNLSLDIYEGDSFALVGRSGCGKSTLMKIMLGFYRPDSGKIYYKGQDITNDLNELRRVIGFTTQENSFYFNLTVFENMVYYAKLYNVKKQDLGKYLERILKYVELDKARDTLAGKISGGMKRRLDFAISLVHDPDIIILDEPTTGLDPILVRSFWEVIQRIRKEGKTIIVASHIFEELEENCNKLGIMNKGSFDIVADIDKVMQYYKSRRLIDAFEKIVK